METGTFTKEESGGGEGPGQDPEQAWEGVKQAQPPVEPWEDFQGRGGNVLFFAVETQAEKQGHWVWQPGTGRPLRGGSFCWQGRPKQKAWGSENRTPPGRHP